MKFNLLMPMRAVKHYDQWIGDGHLSDVAQVAEAAGFHGVAMTEHPFPDDDWLSHGGHHSFDPLIALSFMAAATTTVQLITYVLVSAYRSPYVTAKALATLDNLSGGRMVAGMAAGYLRPEFEVLGADWEHRGQLMDGAIEAMRAAWTGESVHIGGPFPARGHTQLPRPARPGGPPVWIGGNSVSARRRAAGLGQGWMPIGQPPAMAEITRTPPLQTIAELAALVDDVKTRRSAAGGAPLDICFSPFGDRKDVVGWAKQVRRDLAAYEDAGVTWLTVEPSARSLEELRTAVAVVADEVLTHHR